MYKVIEAANWTEFLKRYNDRNGGKPTRIGVFEQTNGRMTDYWIEDGMPLIALDFYIEDGKRRIDIVLESYTHAIDDVAQLTHIDGAGADEGLDVSDADGRTTQLRIEDWVTGNGKNNDG